MNKNDKIYIAGHKGMVGSAIERKLRKEGFVNFVARNSKELDLREQEDVAAFFEDEKPDYVFLAAAKVGGIVANNTYRAEFLYDNLMIEANIIHSAWQWNAKKLMFLGSSCIYPKLAPHCLYIIFCMPPIPLCVKITHKKLVLHTQRNFRNTSCNFP